MVLILSTSYHSRDTDSFLIEIETEDVYADMIRDRQHYDFSDFPHDADIFKKLKLSEEQIHELLNENRKKLGCFKDEAKSMLIEEVVCLRSKSYAMRIRGRVKDNAKVSHSMAEVRKNKSIKKSVMDQHVKLSDFKNYLFAVSKPCKKSRRLKIHQNLIRSKKLCLYNVSQQKTALAGFDIKRKICSNNKNTVSLGYRGLGGKLF